MGSTFLAVSSFFAVSIIFAVSLRKFLASTNRSYAGKDDRISELPQDVIYCIFHRLPTPDAARTAILSRKWRHIWASYPKVEFDSFFFQAIYRKHKTSIEYEFPKAIDNALSLHSGPIYKFFLYIPNIFHHLSPEINRWMLFLSTNKIKELELDGSRSTDYTVPSCIVSCSSLLVLRLRNCILKLPYEFEGFRSLVSLQLIDSSFSYPMSATILQNASLRKLIIIRCTGIELRRICAPRLCIFVMAESGKVDWQWFASNKCLRYVHIELGMEVKNVDQSVNVIEFLEDIPAVRVLYLDGFSLKYLATRNPHKVQHQHLRHSSITHIVLRDFGVDDLDQISSTLCLLKNCPNLKFFNLEIAASANNNVIVPVKEYLEPSNCMDMRLKMLQWVGIKHMKGIKAELLLLKLLLVCSTSLRRIVIELSRGISAKDSAQISRELLESPRASSSLEIIYADLKF